MKLVRVGKMVRAIATQKFVKANFEITPEQFTVLAAIDFIFRISEHKDLLQLLLLLQL